MRDKIIIRASFSILMLVWVGYVALHLGYL